jgi:hypothetical protein
MVAKPEEGAAPPAHIPNMSLDEPVIEAVPVAEEGKPLSEVIEVVPVAEAVPVHGTPAPPPLPPSEDSSVIEAQAVSEIKSGVLEAQPVSEIKSEVLEAQPVSDVITAVPVADSGSDVLAGEPVGSDESDVFVAQPASAVSDVFEAQPASAVEAQADEHIDLVGATPKSGEKPETLEPIVGHGEEIDLVGPEGEEKVKPSTLDPLPTHAHDEGDVLEAEVDEDDSSVFDAHVVEGGSSVFEAEVLAAEDDALAEVEKISSATRRGESVLDEDDVAAIGSSGKAKPGQPESPVPLEEDEDVVEAVEAAPDSGPPARGKKKPHKTDETTEEAEVVAADVDWDDVSEGSSAARMAEAGELAETAQFEPAEDDDEAVEAELEAVEAEEDESSAVNLGQHVAAKGPASGSGIDPVAEALESGVDLDNLDVTAEAAAEASVEFDELLTEDAVTKTGGKKSKKPPHPDDEDALAEALAEVGTDEESVFDAEEAAVAEEGVSASEEGEPAFALEKEESTPKGRKKAKAAVAADEDEEAVAAADDEEVAEAAEEEDEELAATGRKGKKKAGGTAVAEPPPHRGRAMPLMAGTLLGVLLVAGGAGGVWYLQPELIPESPNAKKKPAPPPPATDLQKATEMIAQGNYPQAISRLEGKAGPAELAALGEARWLQYIKEKKKEPLNAEDEPVKKARKELEQADKEHPLLAQMDKALAADKLENQLKLSDSAIREVRAVLEKAKLAEPGAKAEDLSKAIALALASKEQAEKLRDGIGEALAAAKFIADKKDLDVPAFEKLLKDLGEQKNTLTAVNKLLKDAEVKDAGDKGVMAVLTAKKDAEGKLGDVNKVLADEKLAEGGAKGVLKLAEARNKLTKDRDELATVVKSAVDELAGAKIVPADGDPRKLLVEGVKVARSRSESPLAAPLTKLGGSLAGLGMGAAQMLESGLSTARLATELSFYRAREPLLVTPEGRLDSHIAALQNRDNRDPVALASVLNETEFLLTKEGATDPEARSKARYAAGLALRNQEKYDEARQSLQEALKEAKSVGKPGPWLEQAGQALRELSEPDAYYLPRIARAMEAGNVKRALLEANTALKVMPNSGALLAERALAQLEAARRSGVLAGAEKAIRADAAAAQKDATAAAAGAFALGQLEEDLGNLEGAEKLYREAIKSHQDSKGAVQEGYRYRIALARLLQRDRSPAAAAPEEGPPPRPAVEKAEEKTSSLQPTPWHPLTGLALAVALGAQPDEEEPAGAARLLESIKLAQELMASDDPKIKGQGHVLYGQALSKQGRRTEGLREVAKGMSLLYPDRPARDLGKLLDEHPAFQHPDASKQPNPVVAERFFGLGLHHYWERRYPEAEVQFKQAVGHFDLDARYQYFLGLAQLAQKKRDAAYYSFEKGARLEAQGNPRTTDEINFSLERVQGDLRRLLNEFRLRVLTRPAAE